MKTEIPCVTYDEEEKIGKLLVTKIGNPTNNASRKIEKFSSLFGIKELLHVVDTYNQTCEHLDLTATDRWSYFEDVLDSNAKNCWSQHTKDIANNQKTKERLKTKQETFIHSYTGSSNPRDIILDYIRSDKDCKKGQNTSNQAHASKIESLINITNCLQGMEPKQTINNIKRIIFNTFPEKWCDQYKLANNNFATDTLTDILTYFNACKTNADKEVLKAEQTKKCQGQGTHKNKNDDRICGARQNERQIQNMCRRPGHCRHTWYMCYDNPNGPNFRPSQQQGQGQPGRNYQGRRNFPQGGQYNPQGNWGNGRGRGEWGSGHGHSEWGSGCGCGEWGSGRGGWDRNNSQNNHHQHSLHYQTYPTNGPNNQQYFNHHQNLPDNQQSNNRNMGW